METEQCLHMLGHCAFGDRVENAFLTDTFYWAVGDRVENAFFTDTFYYDRHQKHTTRV